MECRCEQEVNWQDNQEGTTDCWTESTRKSEKLSMSCGSEEYSLSQVNR